MFLCECEGSVAFPLGAEIDLVDIPVFNTDPGKKLTKYFMDGTEEKSMFMSQIYRIPADATLDLSAVDNEKAGVYEVPFEFRFVQNVVGEVYVFGTVKVTIGEITTETEQSVTNTDTTTTTTTTKISPKDSNPEDPPYSSPWKTKDQKTYSFNAL